MNMPPAPMPPPIDINVGPFEGVAEGPAFDVGHDDYGRDPFDDYDAFERKPKNKKKNKDDKAPVETRYEGYTLEKAQPRTGENKSWARIGKRALPFDDKALLDMAKRHRQRTRTGPDQDFKLLSSNQQGVVNRLLEEQRRFEKQKNADWVLYDVQRFGKWHWTSMEVKKIQVILKRIDKNQQAKNGLSSSKNDTKTLYQDFEIIDLAVDPNKKKDKKAKKSRSLDDLDPLDDPLGLGQGMPMDPRDRGFDQHMPQGSRDHFDAIPVPPMGPPGAIPVGPPPGAIPIDQNGPNQFPPFQQPYPTSARQSFHGMNPFQPNPDVASPVQFDQHMDGQPWPHPHQGGMDRMRPRSQSGPRERRQSARRPSVDARKFRQLSDKVEDLNYKMSNWRMGSESSEYDEDSIFSSPPSDGQSFSPPSSPRSYFSEVKPRRGSLERRRSSTSHDPRYHPRYRSHRYQDTEIEPAYSNYPDGRRDNGPEYRRHSKRPSLHHSQTYDDYPVGRGAEQRYLPAPPRPMRRLTEYGDNYDYRGEYDDQRRRGQPAPDYDAFREGYEAARRDSVLDGGRRRSYMGSAGGGGGGDYYR